MQKITYTNDRGESVVLTHRAPFILSKVDGLGDVDADIQMQKAPYQDGTTFIDSMLQPRFINIEVSIYGSNRDDISLKRQELGRIFNPKIGGTLLYENGRVKRQIKAYPEHVPKYPSSDRGGQYQISLINLVCPDPYWQSLSITEEPAFKELFEFPSIPYWEEGEYGDLYFEMGMQRNERIILNNGDAQAPIKVDFYGPSDSPMIENLTTGEFIRINKRLEEGEIFKIDTTDGVKSVIYVDVDGNETNVFHWIDLSSTFFKLQIGENEITCNCAISNNMKDFDIYYHKLFNAV